MFRLAIIHSPQKDILRRMFHVDELQDLGTVALVLQKLRDDGTLGQSVPKSEPGGKEEN